MRDRKEQGLEQRVSARRFHDPEVRALLDELDIDDLIIKYGEPRVSVIHHEPRGYWKVGDDRPALADDDPAVMQLIGRCLASRVRGKLDVPAPFSTSVVHPAACAWDDYPDQALLVACDWATWSQRYISTELYVWHNREDRFISYEREGPRSGTYTNPRWAEYWGLAPKEREARLGQLTLGMAA